MKKKIIYLLGGFMICTLIMPMLSSCQKIDYEEEQEEQKDEVIRYDFSITPERKEIGKKAGAYTIIVKSNHEWTVSLNNTGSPVTGLRLGNTSGYGNGSVTVYYDDVKTEYYSEQATILFHHKDGLGHSTITTCSCYRVRRRW